jgi:hypothetical protein
MYPAQLYQVLTVACDEIFTLANEAHAKAWFGLGSDFYTVT